MIFLNLQNTNTILKQDIENEYKFLKTHNSRHPPNSIDDITKAGQCLQPLGDLRLQVHFVHTAGDGGRRRLNHLRLRGHLVEQPRWRSHDGRHFTFASICDPARGRTVATHERRDPEWLRLRMIVIAADHVHLAVAVQHGRFAFGGRVADAAIVVASPFVAHQLKVMVVQFNFHGTGQRRDEGARIGALLEEFFQFVGRQ